MFSQLISISSIDDIEDNSILRRGIPVAHSIYGVASTINAANYILFIALERVQQLGHPEATKVYNEQLLELHRGQGMEIYWRDNFLCPEESEYKQMTIRKTGGLFMLAIRLMLLFSDNEKDFTRLTALLGELKCATSCSEFHLANGDELFRTLFSDTRRLLQSKP